MTGLDIEIIETEERTDFRRANGAPMILDKEGKNQRFSRPSNWGKDLDDENALVNWKINRAIEGVAKDKALQARAVSLDPDADRSEWGDLREAAINAGRGSQSADIGTALHKMTERWEQDDKYDPGPPYTAHLEAYTAEMKRLGLISQMYEFKTVNEEYRAAGTADRLWELSWDLVLPNGDTLPAGTLVIGDLKTGKSLDLSAPAYSVQMAIYAQGELYDVADDRFLPTPVINQEWGIIAWLPSKGEIVCEFRWVDLTAGNYGAWLTHEVRDWRKKWGNGTYACPRIGEPAVADPVEVAEAALVEAFDAVPEVDALIEYGRTRLKAVGEHPEARKKCQLFWPDDVPPPTSITSVPEAMAMNAFLDKIEAEFGLTFVGGDPRTPEPVRRHSK